MKTILKASVIIALVLIGLGASSAFAQCPPKCYVAVNNDASGAANSVTFYSLGASNYNVLSTKSTGGDGYGGGYFGLPRVSIAVSGPSSKCVFVGNADSGSIAEFNYPNAVAGSPLTTSFSGAAFGIGLEAVTVGSSEYLLANWSASGIVEVYSVASSCALTDTGNSATNAGGNGGTLDGFTARGSSNGAIVAGAFADGTVGTYTLSTSGVLSLVGYQTAGAYNTYGATPTQVYITKNGKFLVADSLGGVPSTWDVWAVATNGTLSGDVTTQLSTGGDANIYGSNTFVASPDEDALYINGSFSAFLNGSTDDIATDTFNSSTGAIGTSSCGVAAIPGFDTLWYYAGSTAVASNSGTGLAVVQENASFGNTSGTSYTSVARADSSHCLTFTYTGTPAGPTNSALSLQTYPGSPNQ